MDENSAKRMSYSVIAAAWLAVFCLFGYRATFAVLSGPMAQTMNSPARRALFSGNRIMF